MARLDFFLASLQWLLRKHWSLSVHWLLSKLLLSCVGFFFARNWCKTLKIVVILPWDAERVVKVSQLLNAPNPIT